MKALSIRHVWVALTLAAAFIGPASSPIGLPDLYWTLLTGDWIASHHALLEADPFTSAPSVGGPILNVQWLADLIFHGLDALGGLNLVITGTAVIVTTTYALLLAAAVTASGHLRVSCSVVWIAYALGLSNLSPRPQTLAYPLFALFVLAVMRAEWRKDTRLLWLLPPCTALWANLHGSFFLGFVLLGCVAAGKSISARNLRAARPYFVTLGACVLASLVNPYGPGALVYVATIGSSPVIRDLVTEWAPTTITGLDGILFFGSLILLGSLALKSRLRLTAMEVLLLLAFGYLAWSSVRAVVWWGLAIAPVLARLLGSVAPYRTPGGRDRPPINGLILTGIAMVVAISLPWNKAALPILPANKLGLFSEDTPVGAGEYLRTHDPPSGGLMFNDQNWGGYLEWAAWPRHQVFLDGRFELHPAAVWFDYLDVVFPGAGWAAVLDQYNVSYMVLSEDEHPDLVAEVRHASGWQVDYEDDQAVVFSRALVPSAGP
ncbi:MAG: hypothetical protein LC797_00225 [Chloroflexi bacterium]|nr:hypothetical protein [Chloroflexota bacterium]